MKKIFRLYIDEIGTHDLPKRPDCDFIKRYFGICGIVVESTEQDYLRSRFSKLRDIISADRDYHPTIHIHRKEVLDKTGHFKVLIDKEVENTFNSELLDVIRTSKYSVLFTGIDKYSHLQRYSSPMHPYHYMVSLIMERYVELLEKENATGDIVIESRQKSENDLLQRAFTNFLESGTIGYKSFTPERIKIRISSKNIKFTDKQHNVSGVEMADLLALPCMFYLLDKAKIRNFSEESFNYKVFKSFEDKWDISGRKFIF